MKPCILFIDFKKASELFRREVLYNIFADITQYHHETGKANKMCLNETYTGVRVGKRWSDTFPTKKCLKQGVDFSAFLLNFVLE